MKLTHIDEVQKRVGKLPAPRDLKVINFVDEHALRWLSYCHFAFLAFGRPGQLQLSAAGGEKGFVSAKDPKNLLIPIASLDNKDLVKEGASFGALFLISGMEETLRVNGKVASTEGGIATLSIEECYLHCAKAFKRSGFWLAESEQDSPNEAASFINDSRFLALATISSSGQADVSPKGDPANFLMQEEAGQICFSDRPGNRRIDSFRNIMEQSQVCLIAMVPGVKGVLEVNGTAELCVDENLLKQFEVQGKQPKLVTQITPTSIELKPSKAMDSAKLWPASSRPSDIVPADIFKTHMKLSADKSLAAKLARAAISVPGAMKAGLETDYKKNMY